MNDIVRRITDDGLCGFDSYSQVFCWVRDQRDPESIMNGTIVRDVRGLLCPICNHGWSVKTSAEFGDQYFWDLVRAPVHHGCFARHLGLIDRAEFTSALITAKFRFHGLEPIKNQYWSDWMSARPWFRAEHLDRPVGIDMGWRKRVIEIRVTSREPKPLSWAKAAEVAFANEEVTKSFRGEEVLIHAYGIAKATEYLTRLAELGHFAHQYDEKRPGWAVYGDGFAVDKYAKKEQP